MNIPNVRNTPDLEKINRADANKQRRANTRRVNLDIKLPLMVISLLSLSFLIFTIISVRQIKSALTDTLKNELVAQTNSKAEIVRTNLIWTRGTAIDLAAASEIVNYDEDSILKIIHNTLAHNQQVYGSTIAYEPYQFKPDLYYWAPYYNRLSDTEFQFTQLGNSDYNYYKRDWYTLPKTNGVPVLSPPYFDFGGGNIWMVTWSAPFFNKDGDFMGVATTDIAFSQIQQTISQIEVGQKGYAFLLDSKGTILGIGENAGGYYEDMTDSMLTATYSAKAKNWKGLIDGMLKGDTGFTKSVDPQGNAVFAAYAPVGLDTGWSLALVFPQDELFQKASSPQNSLIFYASFTVVIFGIILYLLTRSITQPLRRLTLHASQLSAENLHITGGNLKETIQIHTGDELEDLAEAYNQMSSDLAQSFETLKEKVTDHARDLAQRSLELETVAEVAREITIIHNLNTLLTVSANLIRERFKYYHVGVFLIDDRGELAILRAASSQFSHQMLEEKHKIKVGQEGAVGSATRTGQAQIALEMSAETDSFQNRFLSETRSEIALPLNNRSITIGALDIQTNTEAAFNEQNITVLQLLADQLAAAIENAQLIQRAEETFAELNNAYRQQTQTVWQTTTNQYNHPAYEYDGFQIRPIPNHLPPHLLKQLEGGEAIVVKENKDHEDGRKKTTLMVPLMVLKQVIGVIGLERDGVDHKWTNEEISIAQAAANRAGITLENARLLEESRRRVKKERAIFNATARIGSALNIGNILHTTTEEIERIIGNSEVIFQFNNDNATSTNEE